jgi:hypothetical protein
LVRELGDAHAERAEKAPKILTFSHIRRASLEPIQSLLCIAQQK